MDKRKRELLKGIKKLGIPKPAILRKNGANHYTVAFDYKGNQFKFQFSTSPSDWRGDKNKMAEIKRAISEMDRNT